MEIEKITGRVLHKLRLENIMQLGGTLTGTCINRYSDISMPDRSTDVCVICDGEAPAGQPVQHTRNLPDCTPCQVEYEHLMVMARYLKELGIKPILEPGAPAKAKGATA